MYGDEALKLVQHAKRTLTLPTLPPHHTDLIHTILRETHSLRQHISHLKQSYPAPSADTDGADPDEDGGARFDARIAPTGAYVRIMVYHLALRRNKRCLMAYHRVRTERIDAVIWAGGEVSDLCAATPGAAGVADEVDTLSVLSPEENSYATSYSDLLAAYKGQWTDVDLTGSLKPPRELFVDVRVVRDAGEIMTEYGAINLTRNSQFYVRLADVESLIRQGFLVRLS